MKKQFCYISLILLIFLIMFYNSKPIDKNETKYTEVVNNQIQEKFDPTLEPSFEQHANYNDFSISPNDNDATLFGDINDKPCTFGSKECDPSLWKFFKPD